VELTRSFYLATPAVEIAGHSPELLARGDSKRFVCYKLSGTGPRHPDPGHDARLRSELLADAKVLQEHSLSLQATRRALATVGSVSAGPMEVVDRRGLRHLMTPLTVDLKPGISWSALMQAVVPTGAAPRESALSALNQLEPESRGVYYGVLGLRTPDGEFEFSQVLRSLIRDRSGVHTFVGAAVTGQSTADGESAETRLKLDDIVAVRATSPGRVRGKRTTQ
jgi:anthranilate/para-aminobenzoate synthase component I